jgi:hypothetical protein
MIKGARGKERKMAAREERVKPIAPPGPGTELLNSLMAIQEEVGRARVLARVIEDATIGPPGSPGAEEQTKDRPTLDNSACFFAKAEDITAPTLAAVAELIDTLERIGRAFAV